MSFSTEGVVILLLFVSLVNGLKVSYDDQESAVIDLIWRLIPDRADEFQVNVNSSLLTEDGKELFEIVPLGLTILITASNGVVAANGFHYYLKQYCKCHVSWSGDQLALPVPLPQPSNPIRVVVQDKVRYYQNVCTASYSMVWWDWVRWEREIDWMALNGINMALAFNGQELIWKRVYSKLGLNDDEINDFFTGPAFLAWNRMGNIEGLFGPLTDSWMSSQVELQKKIVSRMRQFSMTTVLPAFSGHVPRNLTRVFPNANVTHLMPWSHFDNTYSGTAFLEPSDALFARIGSSFIEMLTQEFGTDHFYNTDLWNEMPPRSNQSAYIRAGGEAVYTSIIQADSEAIWVMQGWLFFSEMSFWGKEEAKALLTSVPQGKLLVLDLFSEAYPQYPRLDGYFGQPFVWCMLHNFGGVQGLFGNFDAVNRNVYEARTNFTNMVGIGLTPEGIEQNDVMYDFMMETTWNTESVDVEEWVSNYSVRRYGFQSNRTQKAWTLLSRSVYNNKWLTKNHGQYILVTRPSLHKVLKIWYDYKDLCSAWNELQLEAQNPLIGGSSTFRYDLVDLTRQSMQVIFGIVYKQAMLDYSAKNVVDFAWKSRILLDMLIDLDRLLSSDEHFLLGRWLKSAHTFANGSQDKLDYDVIAKNQITLWGQKGEISDYAVKQWSGVVSDYFYRRWHMFLAFLAQCLAEQDNFNQTVFNELVFNNVEKPFTLKFKQYRTEAQGNPADLAREMYQKYSHLFG